MDDAATANPPKKAGGPVGSPTAPEGNPRQESYCLYIRVLRDSDVVLEQDRKGTGLLLEHWHLQRYLRSLDQGIAGYFLRGFVE